MKRILGLLLSVLLSSALLSAASPASAANENDCTIVGTKNADVITGTEKRDVICAGAGADKIYALGGNDIIRAGSGNDVIYAGAGNDTVLGEAGNDSIAGADGADKLNGGDGIDKVTGGAGEDVLQGGAGNDNLSAGNGADLIDGGKGKDVIYSGYGYDLCNSDPADVRMDACTLDSKGPKFGALPMVVRQVQAGTLAVFTVNVSDVATVDAVYGSIGGAPGWITEWCGFRIPTELASGSVKSGTYKLSCTVPPNAVNDNYTLFVGAVDMMGHTSEQRIAFEVIGGSSDNRTPVVTKIELPNDVAAGESFTVTISATDESVVAGVDAWFALEGGWVSGGDGLYASRSEPRFITQTQTESVVSYDVVFDSRAPAGLYHVWIGVRDGVGNRDFYDSGQTITLTK
jgi:Ca2+-binding RTX toxin-like protein